MTEQGTKSKGIAKGVLSIVGVLLLGTVSNGLWELLVRPGLSRVNTFFVDTFNWIDQAIFTTAALDPTPVSSLIVLVVLAPLPLVVAIRRAFRLLNEKRREREEAELKAMDQAERERYESLANRRRFRRSLLLVSLYLLIGSIVMNAYLIQNNAVMVWRVFHRNLDVTRPYITEVRAMKLTAEFRTMERREDFQKVASELEQIALANNVKLSWYGIPVR